MREVWRFLGLELAGAKNDKTAIASIDYYPVEKKIFLLEIYERIVPREDQSSDEALLELIEELKQPDTTIGCNVPLTLPPCLTCTRATCSPRSTCNVPGVKWMREFEKKLLKKKGMKGLKPSTPYTQRPVELWVRHELLPRLEFGDTIDVDEALGGTKAPLTARMTYVKRHLKGIELSEVWPKLSVAVLSESLQIPSRIVRSHRHLEQGVQSRAEILAELSREYGIFVYERDQKTIAQNLGAFDAFICAFTALLSRRKQTEKPPSGFLPSFGLVEVPRLQ